jgi:SAM-dependent methyltransferase
VVQKTCRFLIGDFSMLYRYLRLYRERRAQLLNSQDAYERWAATYPPIAHNPFMELEQNTLLAMMPPLEGKRVLDLACGSGRWGKVAQERGAAQVISLDFSHAMLVAGRPPLAAESLMSMIPLRAGSVDVVICGLAIGHIVTPRMWSALAEMKRILTPGGMALISDVHPIQMWRGAKRTFWQGRQVFAVEHYIHSYSDYHKAAAQLGLTIPAVEEKSVKEGQPPVLFALKFQRP